MDRVFAPANNARDQQAASRVPQDGSGPAGKLPRSSRPWPRWVTGREAAVGLGMIDPPCLRAVSCARPPSAPLAASHAVPSGAAPLALSSRIVPARGRAIARRLVPRPARVAGKEDIAMTMTDDQALARYRYMLATAPPEDIERAHEEAFAKLTPDQRRQALEALSRVVPPTRSGATTRHRSPERRPGPNCANPARSSGSGVRAARPASAAGSSRRSPRASSGRRSRSRSSTTIPGTRAPPTARIRTAAATGETADAGDFGDFGGDLGRRRLRRRGLRRRRLRRVLARALGRCVR